jgi:hypothetical protein
MLAIARLRRSRRAVSHWFIAYQRALIRDRRLHQISARVSAARAPHRARVLAFGDPATAGAITGFHTIETHGGTDFRWSEAAAITEIEVPAGRLRLRLRCLEVARGLATVRPVFFFNDRLVRPEKMALRGDGIELLVESSRPGRAHLLWICKPLRESGTKRRLGLPVISLSVERRDDPQAHVGNDAGSIH